MSGNLRSIQSSILVGKQIYIFFFTLSDSTGEVVHCVVFFFFFPCTIVTSELWCDGAKTSLEALCCQSCNHNQEFGAPADVNASYFIRHFSCRRVKAARCSPSPTCTPLHPFLPSLLPPSFLPSSLLSACHPCECEAAG